MKEYLSKKNKEMESVGERKMSRQEDELVEEKKMKMEREEQKNK